MSRYNLLVNCRKTSLAANLGVLKFLRGILTSVRAESHFIFLMKDGENPRKGILESVVLPDDQVVETSRFAAERERIEQLPDLIELLPHHFQDRCCSAPSLLLLHDFHAFTVSWKYARPEAVQAELVDCLAAASAIVTHFPYAYYNFKKFTGLHANRLVLIRSPLLVDDEHLADEELAAPESLIAERNARSKKTMLYPAQFQRHKNHARCIEALARVRSTGVDATLVLTGTPFSEEAYREIQEAIERLQLSEHVQFRGFVDDGELYKLFQTVDLTIIPSLAEGGAYVALEALKFGSPVALSDLPAARMHIASVTPEPDNLIWFDPKDIDAIARAMKMGLEGDYADRCRTFAGRLRLAGWADLRSDLLATMEWTLGRGHRPLPQVTPTGRVLELVTDG